MQLPPRWTKLRPHAGQRRYWLSAARFNVAPCGRRSGKTEIAKRRLVRAGLKGTAFADPRFFAGAPVEQQAKRIYWRDLKALVPAWAKAGKPSESELRIDLVNGAEIWVIGFDKPERFEGPSWDGGILDEYANMRRETWGFHVRPALADRGGWCDFIGVPEGRNHYYDLNCDALADTTGEWAVHHWTSAEILPPEEIESARRNLDLLTYDQEFNASFVSFEGRAYYGFTQATHCVAGLAERYDPAAPLVFCFDFNVSPGVACVVQERRLPSGLRGTAVIGEVWIPRHSNTVRVCDRLAEDWKAHRGEVHCYGDYTGDRRQTSQTEGSDWDLIRSALRKTFGDRLRVKVEPNPRERDRVNAFNSRLRSADGLVRLMVDPAAAPHVVKDLDGVRVLEGTTGELDKKSDKELTHISDALGYYVAQEFPVTGDRGARVLELRR